MRGAIRSFSCGEFGGFASHVHRVRDLTNNGDKRVELRPISHARRAHRSVRPGMDVASITRRGRAPLRQLELAKLHEGQRLMSEWQAMLQG